MSRRLRAVPDPVERPVDVAKDIYADVRALAHDPKRWERLHVSAERRAPLDIFQPPHKRSWTTWGCR